MLKVRGLALFLDKVITLYKVNVQRQHPESGGPAFSIFSGKARPGHLRKGGIRAQHKILSPPKHDSIQNPEYRRSASFQQSPAGT